MCVIPAGGFQVQNEPGLPVKPDFRKQKQNSTHKQNLNVLQLRATGEALAWPPATVRMSETSVRQHLRATAAFLSLMIKYCLPKEDQSLCYP